MRWLKRAYTAATVLVEQELERLIRDPALTQAQAVASLDDICRTFPEVFETIGKTRADLRETVSDPSVARERLVELYHAVIGLENDVNMDTIKE